MINPHSTKMLMEFNLCKNFEIFSRKAI